MILEQRVLCLRCFYLENRVVRETFKRRTACTLVCQKVGSLLKCVSLEDFVLSQADASWEKRENFLRILALCALVYYTLHPVQSEEKIRPQQQEQQLAFTYNLWQGNIEAGSLRSCPNGFSPPSSRSRKVVTCEKCNNLGSLSLTCSRWTTETGRITEEENHYRKRGR